MRSDQIYGQWKKQKRQIEIRRGFSAKAMKRICEYEQSKHSFALVKVIEFIYTQPLVKVGLVASGAIAGFVRLVFVIVGILNGVNING